MTDKSGFSENAVKLACMLNLGWKVNHNFATKTATLNGKQIPLAPIIELQLVNFVSLDQKTGDVTLTDWAKKYLDESYPPEDWEELRRLNPTI